MMFEKMIKDIKTILAEIEPVSAEYVILSMFMAACARSAIGDHRALNQLYDFCIELAKLQVAEKHAMAGHKKTMSIN